MTRSIIIEQAYKKTTLKQNFRNTSSVFEFRPCGCSENDATATLKQLIKKKQKKPSPRK